MINENWINNIPARSDPTHIPSTTAAAGMTAKKLRRKKLSTTKGEAKGRTKQVSYCPICVQTNMVHPESHPHITVTIKQKKGNCKAGHTWAVC